MDLRKFLIGSGRWLRSTNFGGIMSFVVAWLALILPLIAPDAVGKYFGIESSTEIVSRVLLAIVGTLVVFVAIQLLGFVLIYTGKNTRPSRIKMVPLNPPDQVQNGTTIRNFAGLNVRNEDDAELTDCYVLLKSGHLTTMPKLNIAARWAGQGSQKVRWKSTPECVMKLDPKIGEEILHIYELAIDLTRNDVSISNFCICGNDQIQLNPVGEYEFQIELCGKLDGEFFRPIPYHGSFAVSVKKEADSIEIDGLRIRPLPA